MLGNKFCISQLKESTGVRFFSPTEQWELVFMREGTKAQQKGHQGQWYLA